MDVICAGPSSCPLGACDTKIVIQGRDEIITPSTASASPTAVQTGGQSQTSVLATISVCSGVSWGANTGGPSAKTVGLAVGIPLGLIALTACLGSFYLWRKLRVALANHSTAFKETEYANESVVRIQPAFSEPPPNYEKGKPGLNL